MGDDIDIRPSTIWSILEMDQSETIKTSINGLSELEAIYENKIQDLEFNSYVLFDFIHNKRSYQYIYNAYRVTVLACTPNLPVGGLGVHVENVCINPHLNLIMLLKYFTQNIF